MVFGKSGRALVRAKRTKLSGPVVSSAAGSSRISHREGQLTGIADGIVLVAVVEHEPEDSGEASSDTAQCSLDSPGGDAQRRGGQSLWAW